VTTDSHEAKQLVDLAQAQHLTLMVGHIFLFNAGVRTAKRFLDSRETGKLYYLHATRTNLGPIRTDVNAIWDLAPHDVSIFDHLLGVMPEWASAVGARVLGNCREDVGFITLGYSDGVIGNIHVSWADPNKVRQVVVVGSDMRIVFNDLSAQERVRVFNKGVSVVTPEAESYGEFRFLLRDGDIVSPLVESSEPLKNQATHFLQCIHDGTTPISDGMAGYRVVRVMEAIDCSMQQRGAPVSV
jgi:predicted dehydrogenase